MKNVIISILAEGGLVTLKLDRLEMAALLEYSEPLLCIDLGQCVVTTCEFESSEPGKTLNPEFLIFGDEDVVTPETVVHPYTAEEDPIDPRSAIWDKIPFWQPLDLG